MMKYTGITPGDNIKHTFTIPKVHRQCHHHKRDRKTMFATKNNTEDPLKNNTTISMMKDTTISGKTRVQRNGHNEIPKNKIP